MVARGSIDYGNGHLFDAFAPAGEARPAAIVIHGSSGNRRTHVNQVLAVLEKAGWAWFSVDYRDVADVRRAIRFIQCRGRFNIQSKPVLIGEDTGAAIAFEVAATGTFRSVVAFGAAKDSHTKDPGVPVLLFHGDADEESPIAPMKTLCERWRDCTFVPVAKGIHNVENWHPDQWAWKEDLAAWLREDRRGVWKDIAYAMPEGRALLMNAFLPEGVGPFNAVIVVHGGGWEAGDKETYISPMLDVLARERFAYFSIDYRLTPYVTNGTQLEDVRAAIRYVRAHSDRFHARADSIALLGESAGGQVVTQLASLPCAGCEVGAVVSLYGVYNFKQFTQDADGKQMLKRIFGQWTLPMLEEASPLYNIKAGMPRLLLIQGTKDELYAGTLAYDQALTKKGIEHKLVVLDGAPHGMENWVGHAVWMKALDDAAVWLRGR